MPDKQKSCWVEILGLVTNIAIVAVAAIAVLAAFRSNAVARRGNLLTESSLRSAYTPWLQVIDIKASETDANTVTVECAFKNFGNGPALNLKTDYTALGTRSRPVERIDAIMPGQSVAMQFTLTRKGDAGALMKQLYRRGATFLAETTCEDAFGTQLSFWEQRECIDGKFRMHNYKVDGLGNLNLEDYHY